MRVTAEWATTAKTATLTGVASPVVDTELFGKGVIGGRMP
jgi:hypothetical protein